MYSSTCTGIHMTLRPFVYVPLKPYPPLQAHMRLRAPSLLVLYSERFLFCGVVSKAFEGDGAALGAAVITERPLREDLSSHSE